MKLCRLDLIRFGHFSDRALEFPDDRGGLHVIHGPNEAGKSTALRAISALLFGFPERTRDAHLHPARELRVAAALENAAGARIDVVRRKGRKQTLLDPTEQALPDSALDPFLGGVDREVFERMFGLDHARLVQGGAELLAGRGEVGSALLGAAAGLSGVRQLADALAAEAAEIFKPNAQIPSLNQALKAHQAARKQLREATVAPAEWDRTENARDEARAELDEIRERLAADRRALRARTDLRDALPDLRARAAILARRQALGDAVDLPSDARDRRLDAERRLESACVRIAQLEDERELRLESRDKLVVPEALLAAARRVQSLSDQRAVVLKADRDRRELAGKIEAGDVELERLRTRLPKAPTIAELEGRGLDDGLQARIREIAREGEGLRVRVETLDRARTAGEQALEEARRELADLPPDRDVSTLASVVAAARRVVALETTRTERLAHGEREREAARRELEALPRWSGTLAALAALSVPDDVTLETFARRFERLAEERREREERRRILAERLSVLEQDLTRLDGSDAPPGPDDLRGARRRRDDLWRGVRRRLVDEDGYGADEDESDGLEGAAPPEREDPPETLAAAYEHAVGEADRTGDRLFDEHERVARRSQLETESERLRVQHATLEQELVALAEREETCREGWRALWDTSAVALGSPEEMRAWKRARSALLERLDRIEEAVGAATADGRQLDEHRDACLRAFQALDLPAPDASLALSALIEQGTIWIDRIKREQADRERLEREVERAGRALEADRRALAEAEQRLGDWRRRWSEAVAPLELGAEASPAEAEALLDAIDRIFQRHHQLDGFRDRVRHIDADAARFEQAVDELVAEVCPELGEGPGERRVAELAERLQRAQADRTEREGLDRRIEEIGVELQEIARVRDAALASIGELVALAGVDDAADLDSAEQRSAERQELSRRLAETEERLRRVGPPLDELEALAVDADETELEAEIEELERRIETADRERETCAQRLEGCERDLAQIDGGEAAAEASRALEEALAAIERLTSAYAEAKLGELQLREAMRRFSEENQDPILARTSELFRRMTLDRYRGVVVGYSEGDTPVLLCERAGGERVGMEALSDGTRDQLYLGLRLAALDHHAERAEAMPLIVDDVLLTFDDPRARVSLELMSDLSTRYQVLFFTHHDHLVELARAAVPADRLVVHELADG